jgi:hypothetical protein
MYDQDDLLQLVFVATETIVKQEFENRFLPLSSNIPVDLETLPITLRVGVKLNSDLNHIGHSARLHLSKLKDV